MPRTRDDSKALYMGNLRPDCRRQDLKQRMVNAHHKFNIFITIKCIYVVEKPDRNYAFIYYNTIDDLNAALREFSDNTDDVDIRDFVAPGWNLKVGRKHTPKDKASNLKQDNQFDSPGASASEHLLHQQFTDLNCRKDGKRANDNKKSWQYVASQPAGPRKSSSLGQANNSNSAERPMPMHLTAKSAMSDTVLVYHGANAHGHVDPDQVSSFRYVRGSRLGNETRCVEFKCGQGQYVKKQLMQHVAKYMCAFLNSQGGLLVIGVADDGTVKGIEGMDRRTEDNIRTRIDGVIRGMTPKVFPSMYRASFIDVLDRAGRPIPEVKVIEVEVEQGTALQLYETDRGDVYMRRDGSVQGPLKASDIQEWTRIQLMKEKEKLNDEIKDLEEKGRTDGNQKEFEHLQRSRTRLADCNERLERERQALLERTRALETERDFYKREATSRQSKICVIS